MESLFSLDVGTKQTVVLGKKLIRLFTQPNYLYYIKS